jgi:hypothetical protein
MAVDDEMLEILVRLIDSKCVNHYLLSNYSLLEGFMLNQNMKQAHLLQ